MMEAHILEVVYGLMNNMKVVMDGEKGPYLIPGICSEFCLCRRRGVN